MLTELKVDSSIIPMSRLTVIYGGDREPMLDLPNVKFYNFLQDRNVTLENLITLHEHSVASFAKLNLADKSVDCARHILGLTSLKFDYETKSFETDGLKNQSIGGLSTGTVNAIAVCCIIMNPFIFGGDNGIIYIHHPETSLHPKTCSALGRQIVELYATNLDIDEKTPQIIVNTWNEHILNGARVGAKKLSSNDLSFLTVNFTMYGKWHSLFLENDVSFSDWPENFMDQHMKDMQELLKERIKK